MALCCALTLTACDNGTGSGKNEPSEGLEYTLSQDGNGYCVSGIGTCTDTDIVIPQMHNGEPVTSIGNSAFENCTSLKNITIPNSVTSIGQSAFSGCTKLSSITIPNSVTSIGSGAFRGCTKLSSITIPNGVTSIGNGAFGGCTKLSSITIPNGVTSIGAGAFADCTKLSSVTIPDGVTSIGNGAFSGCTKLSSITIPDSVTSIGERAFEDTAYYSNSDNWVDGVLYINDWLIDADSLAADYAIKAGVKHIADEALSFCENLKNLTIPDSVNSIGDRVFFDCSSLESIVVTPGNTVYHSDGNCLIETYSGTLIAGCKNSIIPNDESVINIGEHAFYFCTSLENITIPDSVRGIGRFAFCGCTSLRSITISDGVRNIGSYAFSGCENLASITIPDSVRSIGNDAFGTCRSLESIVVDSENTVYHSADNCLIETSSKTLVVGCKNSIIPNDGSVTSIDSYAFSGCENLASITIPDCVNRIGTYAFLSCKSLENIYFTGTMAQWEKIEKADSWNYRTGNYTIHCTDGDIAKESD